MIERIHLTIIQALDEHGSLTKAAESLSLTQSALSHAMGKLEAGLNMSLWKRKGRRLHLTQAGDYLLQISRQVLPVLAQAEHTIKDFGAGKRGTLRIGMECHPCYEWLLKVVAQFLQRWPDVDLDVIQRHQFNGIDALLNHQVDVLLTVDPIYNEALWFVAVSDFELMLVVANQHPLVNRTMIVPEDLQTQHLLTYPVPRERLDVFTQFLIPAAVQPKSHRQVEATEIMLQLVAAGRGVCTLPDWMLDKYRLAFPLTGLHLGAKGILKKLYVALRKEDIGIAYVQDFVALSSS